MSFWKQSGKKPKELDQTEIPEETGHLYSAFVDIKNGCDFLDITTIRNWCDLTGETFSKREIKIILEIANKHREVTHG
jgi:hypothetical protein